MNDKITELVVGDLWFTKETRQMEEEISFWLILPKKYVYTFGDCRFRGSIIYLDKPHIFISNINESWEFVKKL